jgi:hypothetical protein
MAQQMPNPRDGHKVRRWRELHELGATLCRMPGVTSAHIGYPDSDLFLKDGELRVVHEDMTLTLEQIPGYIAALEGDVLAAQDELRRQDIGKVE